MLLSKKGKPLFKIPFTFDGFLSIFIPEKGFLITPILIDLNLFVFLIMAAKGVHILFPADQSLIKWGANLRVLTMDGFWWRLITNCFVQDGILALLVNMFALYCLGNILEPRLGPVRHAVAYFLLVLFSSVFSIYWNVYTISAGAAGPVFGLCGVFFALLTANALEKPVRLPLLISILVFAGYYIILDYNIIKPLKGHVDNAANIGGLAFGLVIGYGNYFSLKRPESTSLKYITLTALLILVAGGSCFLYASTPKDIIVYQNNLGAIADIENSALKYYTLPLDAPKEEKIAALDSGIYFWNEYLEIAKKNEKLRLPANMRAANKQLLQYGSLRMKSYQFIDTDVQQNNTLLQDSILYYDAKIENLIGNMQGSNR